MLGLTHEEKQVLLFLVSAALAGIGADFLVKTYSPDKTAAAFIQDLGKIDLNSADKELLMSVTGLGEKLSGRIIEYRQSHGAFRQVEDLKNIKGITGYRFEKIKESFVVD